MGIHFPPIVQLYDQISANYSVSVNFFYRKSTIGTTIAAIEAMNDTYCPEKRIEKFPLYLFHIFERTIELCVVQIREAELYLAESSSFLCCLYQLHRTYGSILGFVINKCEHFRMNELR